MICIVCILCRNVDIYIIYDHEPQPLNICWKDSGRNGTENDLCCFKVTPTPNQKERECGEENEKQKKKKFKRVVINYRLAIDPCAARTEWESNQSESKSETCSKSTNIDSRECHSQLQFVIFTQECV
ncbi:CLUMA_CG002819, isoform A [Clunio marinus]|uniref:CLUMA_CG002819, isoform A n=1 Tax=Clunio marinus TaxID=568069 RepID=A0A1J1HNE9_9DIPT|nr:CLUMA_CG002819, isoform A [Clunio marinus]